MKTQIITVVSILDAKAVMEYYKKIFKENLKLENVIFMEGNPEILKYADLILFNTKIIMYDARISFPGNGVEIKDVNNFQENSGKFYMSFYVYIPDAEKEYNNAIENGMEVTHPIKNAYWGDRCGIVKDKFGVTWCFATPLKGTSEC